MFKTPSFPAAIRSQQTATPINLYYGAADSCIALAHGSIGCLLAWLDSNGKIPSMPATGGSGKSKSTPEG